jgi:hypothetical protein
VRVAYDETREVEIVARLSASSTGGAPLAGRPVAIFRADTQIGTGITDANGEVRATATVRGMFTGTSATAFRVQHAGDFYFASQTMFVPLVTERAAPQITWPAPLGIGYGTALGAPQLNATANVGGTFAYTPAGDTLLPVGTHILSVIFTPWYPQNYTTATGTVSVDVTKATPTVSISAPGATYDGVPHGATGTLTGVGGVSLGPLTFTYNGASDAPVNAGTYDVVASFAGDANHAAVAGTATLTIAKAVVTVTANGGAYSYDGAAHLATGTVSGVGGVALGPLTFTYNAASDAPVNAGTYDVVASFAGDANHAAVAGTATLTIAKALATLTASGGAYTYDGAAHAATGTVSGVRGVSLGPLTFTYNAASEAPVNAGTYDVVASFAGDANHAAASATATVTIGKAATVLQWVAPSAITYGAPLGASQLSATASTAGTFAYSPAAGTVPGAGTHTLSVTFTPGDLTNYTVESVTTTITIARASLTVRAADAVKRFGAPLPAFTATAAGFVNGDSFASLAGTLVLATAATQQSAVGAYPIVASGVSSFNYAIAFVNGTLSVIRATGNVAVATLPEPSGYEAPMTLTASVSAAIPGAGSPTGVVRFFDGATLLGSAVLNAGAATLSTAGLDAGTRTFEARYDGDLAFEPGTASAPHVIRAADQTPALVVSSSRNPSSAGQSVTLTATVTMPSGAVTGTVDFFSGATFLGTSTISAGRATFTTTSLATRSHAITARYRGLGTVPPGRSEVFVQSVGSTGWKNRVTSMAVTVAPNPATLGDTVVVTATVTGSASVAPTGRILFMVDGVVVGEPTATAVSSTVARATLTVPGLAHGRHAISATYLGDPTYKGSTGRATGTVN